MNPELYPSPPPEPPFPEFVSGMAPEEVKKKLGSFKNLKKIQRKQWVKSMTDQQLMAYLEDNLRIPSPPGTINRMILEGVVNWIEGFKRGIRGEY